MAEGGHSCNTRLRCRIVSLDLDHHRQAPISKRANSTLASPIHSSRRALAVGPCSIRFPIVGPEKRGRKVNRRPTSDSGVAAERTCCTLSLPKKCTAFGRRDRNRSWRHILAIAVRRVWNGKVLLPLWSAVVLLYLGFPDGLCVEVSVPISLPVAFPFSIPVGPGDDGRGLCVELVLPIPSPLGSAPPLVLL